MLLFLLFLVRSVQKEREQPKLSPLRNLHDTIWSALFNDLKNVARSVSEIVGHTIEPIVEDIDQALDDYLADHDDTDIWYNFHEFIEDWVADISDTTKYTVA